MVSAPDDPILYFAFGAMVNPVSRERRGVVSKNERPAVLPNFKLVFEFAGAASITPCNSEEVHGVLMELNQESWQNLKDFEKGYDIVREKVIPYSHNGESVLANVFRFLPRGDKTTKEKEEPEGARRRSSIPQERYLKVIAMGMEQTGVRRNYIQEKILNQECTPSAKPEDYETLPEEGELTKISYDRYKYLCASRACFIVGKRVAEFDSFLPRHPFEVWMKKNAVGKEDCTWTIWRALLEPDMPAVERKEDLTPLHARWAEHQLAQGLGSAGVLLPTVRFLLE